MFSAEFQKTIQLNIAASGFFCFDTNGLCVEGDKKMLESIKRGLGWGGVLASALNSWALALNIPPIHDAITQNNVLITAVATYRNMWSPVVQFLQERLQFDMSQPTADWMSLTFLVVFAFTFKGNGMTRFVALASLASAAGAIALTYYRDGYTLDELSSFFVLAPMLIISLSVIFPIVSSLVGHSAGVEKDLYNSALGIILQIIAAMALLAGLTFGLDSVLA